MPQISTVVINDGAATPVATTFSPIGKDDKGVMWFEQTNPVPSNRLTAWRLSYKQVRGITPNTKQLTGVSKIIYALHLPTGETLSTNDAGITPAPTIAYAEKARMEFDVAERATDQERKHLRVLCANLLGHAMAIANIDTIQPSYS